MGGEVAFAFFFFLGLIVIMIGLVYPPQHYLSYYALLCFSFSLSYFVKSDIYTRPSTAKRSSFWLAGWLGVGVISPRHKCDGQVCVLDFFLA